jgi:alkylation response protein AidB-like acyl-CoA dehydrogenase
MFIRAAPRTVCRPVKNYDFDVRLSCLGQQTVWPNSFCTAVDVHDVQILGGNGYINEYPTGRLLRDAKLYEIGAGTSEIRRYLIGRELAKECREGRLGW